MSRAAAVSDCASLLTFATHSRPRASRARYFFEKPPFTSSRKRKRRLARRPGAPAARPSSSTSATSATTVRVIPFANISSHAHGGRRLKSAAYDPAPFLLRVDTGECEEILPKGGRQ